MFSNSIFSLFDVINIFPFNFQDIRPTKLGDALLRDQILDYDLVRQLREDMNKIKVFRGVYDKRFVGSSQHATATHILSNLEAPNDSEALKCLRADIRYFRWRNGVVGHTTVIWSACVEPNCALIQKLQSASDLLEAIDMTEQERGEPLPPSLLYATAALLEGCSFINGGSQNTLSCPGLLDLAKQQLGVYCLGTDFKAGQTKFKTAAVEYLRTTGLIPRVIASSNHLGNNDMRNLASSDAASSAKLRVKHDIFASWQETELDHKVSIMYTEFINDDKRDFVEYTSLGFLGQTHTMVTYTRASDSILCVPLLIDSAVWCDYFSASSWPFEKVSKALAYLFKVPEGAAKDVDPGFFKQMHELELQVLGVQASKKGSLNRDNAIKRHVRIRDFEKTAEWIIPDNASIICAGLACVDMQLHRATGGGGGENIETFEGETSIGGGSVSMACKTLARLCHGTPLDEEIFMYVTPPVVHSVIPLCKVGMDSTGDKLISLLENSGSACRNVDTKHIKAARSWDPKARTALAVLPIYQDGQRGCFFDAASNITFSAREMVDLLNSLSSGSSGPVLNRSNMSSDDVENYHADLEQMTPVYGALIFGYPHLLPNMQGTALAQILLEARSVMVEGGIIALDLNGVPDVPFRRDGDLRAVSDLRCDPIIGAALEHVDILHMNEDELCLLTGCILRGTTESELEDLYTINKAVDLFLLCNVAVVAVTRGRKGSFVRSNNEDRFRRSNALPTPWIESTCHMGCAELLDGTEINGNGAGDSFTAALVVASMLRKTGIASSITGVGNTNIDKIPTEFALACHSVQHPRDQKKRLTPYNLYMREHYVTLKTQLSDDKKAIFSKCHEMWENETDEVKAMFERKAIEESEHTIHDEQSVKVNSSVIEAKNVEISRLPESFPHDVYATNHSFSFESAVKFANLVAAHHVNSKTRDQLHVDISCLIERAMKGPTRLEEI
jgi:myo-inositol-1-phosphate synthase